MRFSDLIGWLVRREVKEFQREEDPMKKDIQRRQEEMQRRLEIRQLQRENIRAQVRAIGGGNE